MVELLLSKDDIQVNLAYNDGATPLLIAAHEGHHRVVDLLLNTNDIKVNQAMNMGGTPLLFATKNGHNKVIKSLLRKDGILGLMMLCMVKKCK